MTMNNNSSLSDLSTVNCQLSTKKIAVVILNWNGCKLMEKFLTSVIDYSPSELSEVVVADNGSTDASIAMLKEKFPSVRIIQLDKLRLRRRIQSGNQSDRQ